MQMHDFMKLDHQVLLHLLLDLAEQFSPDQAEQCVSALQAVLAKEKVEVGLDQKALQTLVDKVLWSKEGNFGPLAAFLGGYVS